MHVQLQRAYDQCIKGAWMHPFFLIPLGHCEWYETTPDLDIDTAAIQVNIKEGKPEINLYLNTEWISQLPDDEIFGVMSHEILHAMLRHQERSGGKDQEIWGQAADMAINSSLTQSNIKLPRSALMPPSEHAESAAEEIYELLLAEKIAKPKNYNPKIACQGCMPKPGGNGRGDQDSKNSSQEGSGSAEGEGQGKGQGSSGDTGDSDRAWGEMIVQAQSYSRGTGTQKIMARMFKPAPVKTPWARLLRQVANRACSKGGRDSQSYARINRRSTDIIFPGWQSNSPAISVMIDTSGSVSDEMLRAALSSVKECAKATSVRIFLALHDGVCYYSGWIKPEVTVEQLAALCTARGGTDPKQAFEAVRNAKGRFDACVYLTDGEVGQYPDKPQNVKRMLVGIVGDGKYGAVIPSTWQKVDVELR